MIYDSHYCRGEHTTHVCIEISHVNSVPYNNIFLVQAMAQVSKDNMKVAKHLAGWSLGCSIFSLASIVIAPIIIFVAIAAA